MSIRRRVGISLALAGLLVAVGSAAIGLTQPPASAAAARLETGEQDAARQATQPSPSPKPGAPKPGVAKPGGAGHQAGPHNPDEMRRRHEQFQERLAANLGITRQQLADGVKKTRIDLIKQFVQEGKLSQEQADRQIQRINSGQAGGPPGRAGGHGPGATKPGAAGGDRRADFHGLALAARAIGVTPQELRNEIQAGKSIAQVAAAKGIERPDLRTRVIAEQKKVLDAAVARGDLTTERAQQVAARFAASIDRFIDATRPGTSGAPQPSGNRGAQ